MLQRHPIAAFFAITFGISWGLAAIFWILKGLGLGFLDDEGSGLFTRILFLLAVWAPNISALLVTWMVGGWGSLRDLFSRLSPRRADARWWLVALLLPLGLQAISVLLAKSFVSRASCRTAGRSC